MLLLAVSKANVLARLCRFVPSFDRMTLTASSGCLFTWCVRLDLTLRLAGVVFGALVVVVGGGGGCGCSAFAAVGGWHLDEQ